MVLERFKKFGSSVTLAGQGPEQILLFCHPELVEGRQDKQGWFAPPSPKGAGGLTPSALVSIKKY
jgi:hypothetical protein